MKIIKAFLVLFVFSFAGQINAQPSYLVGTAKVSIEPDKSVISLALGGYAAPREGRFTLQWINKGPLPEAAAMGGLSDKLYIVSNYELLSMIPSESNLIWEKAGKAENIKSITGLDGKLYATDKNGELLEKTVKGAAKWKKIGIADKSVNSMAAIYNKLFATNEEGSIWTLDLSKRNIKWIKDETIKGIICLTSNNNNKRLYALTNDGIIYQCEPEKKDSKWIKIAYKNGITIKEDIRRIAIVNNTIYGVSDKNILYEGEHRSDGNLTARAIAIKDQDRTVVIAVADVVGVTGDFTGEIKKEVFQKSGIPASAIFINSIHTHFAPVTQDWLTWQDQNKRPDSIYLATVRNGILDAIYGALKSMAPADLYFGRGKTDIGYNRSLKEHQELYDSTVDVIKVKYTENNTESYMFIASCHPVFSTAGKLHYTLSANFPGVARKLVEDRTGTSNSLFLQGTAGDINPRDNGEYISGEKLSNSVIATLNLPLTKINGPISFYLDTINVSINPWSKDEILTFRNSNINNPGNMSAERNVKWSDLMLKYYNNGTMPKSMPVYVNTINIGNWKLVGFSRETTTGYSLGVKNLWPDKLVSVAGYTNDVSSYLPTYMHLEQRGYEGLDSFFWYGMPAVFPMNVDSVILNTVKSNEH